MTTICLVRHGETDWNSIGRLQGRTDIPLNSKGLLQAEECGVYLKDSLWDLLITSPLKRALQTAESIQEKINVPLVVMEHFIERNYGDAEGMTLQERLTAFPDRNYPNQESKSSLGNRVLFGINEINQMYKGKKIVIVAHGGVINSILASLSSGEIGSGKTVLINACICNIYFEKDQWQIKDFNQVSHLSEYVQKERV